MLDYSARMPKYFKRDYDRNIMRYTLENSADDSTDFKRYGMSLITVVNKKVDTYLAKFKIFNGLFNWIPNRCPWDDHESGITSDGINGLKNPGLYIITTYKGFKVPILRTGRFEFIVCCSGGTLLGYPVYNPSYQFGHYATYIGRNEAAKEIEFVKPLSELEGLDYEDIFEDACKVYDCTSFYKQRTAIFTRVSL